MPVVLKKDIENAFASITVQELHEKHFDPNWHFHPHYQIFTVLNSNGTRFIGDDIAVFNTGDTVFLGPDLPHLWRNDKAYFEGTATSEAHGLVLYFTDDFLGKDFFEKPEMHLIKNLLEHSKRGISWSEKSNKLIIGYLKEILILNGFDRILKLLELLHLLSQDKNYTFITKEGYANSHKVSETERMQKVHDFVLKNFKTEIKLQEISETISMSEAAFCRYFKKRANKTFTDFVNEIRIGNACKMIAEQKYSISEICFESGFNTISNFNHQFKKIVHKTPSEYLKALKI
jgi:AraC-like DNA-binding protein